jgi:hypothetical protein
LDRKRQTTRRLISSLGFCLVLLSLAGGCGRKQAEKEKAAARTPLVTIGEDQSVSSVPAWRAPLIEVTEANATALRKRAEAALKSGQLYGDTNDAEAAIPLYLALQKHAPQDARVRKGMHEALVALVEEGRDALVAIDGDPQELRHAHEVAAVAWKRSSTGSTARTRRRMPTSWARSRSMPGASVKRRKPPAPSPTSARR